jgi:hypothetical protein
MSIEIGLVEVKAGRLLFNVRDVGAKGGGAAGVQRAGSESSALWPGDGKHFLVLPPKGLARTGTQILTSQVAMQIADALTFQSSSSNPSAKIVSMSRVPASTRRI